jgi:hypothetical protein
MSLTFKKHIHTGQWKYFALDTTDIKYQKKLIGHIHERKNEKERYQINLMVKKEIIKEDPAPFKWITLKRKFSEEKEAREWIKNMEKAIFKKYNLYQLED